MFDRELEDGHDEELDEELRPTDDDDGPLLVCRACETVVARTAWVGAPDDGPAARVFFNPQGVVMKVVCLRRVAHVRAGGTPTQEFSWFPGYAWSYGMCGGCGRQLGWRFTPVGAGTTFWTVLADAVVEREE